MLGSIRKQLGFTVAELVVGITVLNILIIGVLLSFTNFYASTARQNVTVQLTIEAQNILRDIVEEIRVGSGVLLNNSITDANAPGGAWETSQDDIVIIIAVPALDSNNDFINNPETGEYYLNELVYFAEGNTLYKRTLAHPDAPDNQLTTTCPEALATATCPRDLKFSDSFSQMTFTFYDQDNDVIVDPLLARSIGMTIDLSSETFEEPVEVKNQTRITFRNNAT